VNRKVPDLHALNFIYQFKIGLIITSEPKHSLNYAIHFCWKKMFVIMNLGKVRRHSTR
jgi:hypothetical protein